MGLVPACRGDNCASSSELAAVNAKTTASDDPVGDEGPPFAAFTTKDASKGSGDRLEAAENTCESMVSFSVVVIVVVRSCGLLKLLSAASPADIGDDDWNGDDEKSIVSSPCPSPGGILCRSNFYY